MDWLFGSRKQAVGRLVLWSIVLLFAVCMLTPFIDAPHALAAELHGQDSSLAVSGGIATQASKLDVDVSAGVRSAQAISTNTGHKGKFDKANAWYSFTLKSSSRVILGVDTDVVPIYKWYAYDNTVAFIYSAETLRTTNDYDYLMTVQGSKQWRSGSMYLAAGTYYVRLYTSSERNTWGKEYSLQVIAQESDSIEQEANETRESANEIALNKAYSGSLYRPADESIYDKVVDHDYFRFSLPALARVSLSFNTDDVPKYVTAYIYSAKSLQTTDDPDYTLSISDTKQWVSGSFYLAPGEYFVELRTSHEVYEGASSNTNIWGHDYSFRVNASTVALGELEPNDSISTATPITLNNAYLGSLYRPTAIDKQCTDSDYFSFTLSKRTTIDLRFSTDVVPPSADTSRLVYAPATPVAYLYSAATLSKTNDFDSKITISGARDWASNSIVLGAGTYYVCLQATSSSNVWGHGYSFMVHKKTANTLAAKAKSQVIKVKRNKNKKTVVKRSEALSIENARGRLSFKKVSGSKSIAIGKNSGNITLKKGVKKKTYKVTVKVRAAGNDMYKAKSVNVSLKIRVGSASKSKTR